MALALPRLTTYADYLDLYAREQPGADAVWHAGRTLSYRDLAEQVARMADALAAAGVEAGDRVAVLCTPRPEYLVSLLAAMRRGAVWVGLNPKYTYRSWGTWCRIRAPALLCPSRRSTVATSSPMSPGLRGSMASPASTGWTPARRLVCSPNFPPARDRLTTRRSRTTRR